MQRRRKGSLPFPAELGPLVRDTAWALLWTQRPPTCARVMMVAWIPLEIMPSLAPQCARGRHNDLRNKFTALCQYAGLKVEMEVGP